MQTAQTQILTLLDYGRITVSEAEHLLVATARPIAESRTAHRLLLTSFWLLLALIAGACLSPELRAIALQAARWFDHAAPSLQLFFNRLMEAYL